MIYSSIFHFEVSAESSAESGRFNKAQNYAIQKYSTKEFDFIHEGKFKLFCLKDSIDEILFETTDAIALFFGSIKNFGELNEIIINHPNYKDLKAPKNVAETIYRLFQLYNEQAFNLINGLFEFLIYDKSTDTLKVFIDRFGINFCYFYSDELGITGSSSMDLLLSTGIKRELSRDGIDD